MNRRRTRPRPQWAQSIKVFPNSLKPVSAGRGGTRPARRGRGRLGVRHMVPQHRRLRFDERQTVLRVKLVFDPGVHDRNIAGAEALRLVVNGHRDVTFDDPHDLLRGSCECRRTVVPGSYVT